MLHCLLSVVRCVLLKQFRHTEVHLILQRTHVMDQIGFAYLQEWVRIQTPFLQEKKGEKRLTLHPHDATTHAYMLQSWNHWGTLCREHSPSNKSRPLFMFQARKARKTIIQISMKGWRVNNERIVSFEYTIPFESPFGKKRESSWIFFRFYQLIIHNCTFLMHFTSIQRGFH